eukprot:GHVU01039180.1.p2 GENE.GHVU01039180.1~~GHVU01039180.1.p2  ORF type:complete len:105 (+),score=6.17 GHVU01039180.1:491-805(+)
MSPSPLSRDSPGPSSPTIDARQRRIEASCPRRLGSFSTDGGASRRAVRNAKYRSIGCSCPPNHLPQAPPSKPLLLERKTMKQGCVAAGGFEVLVGLRERVSVAG